MKPFYTLTNYSMKKFFLFIASVLMVGTFAVSCNPEDEGGDDGKKEDVTPVEKSKAAKILTFSLANGSAVVEGEIFDSQKIVELQYNPEDIAAITDGTASYTISEKATIAPDPATIKDWSSDVKLTVTAEDGETTNEYTVKAVALSYDVAIAPTFTAAKLLTEIGAENDIAFYGGNQIGFSGLDIVTCDGRVYDLDFTFKGNLNMEGIAPGAIMGLGNDDNGVLVAAVGYGDPEFTAAPVDGDGAITWNYTNATRFFVWKNGWEAAPEKIYENGSRLMYINVNGDVNGKMLITAKQGVNDGGNGNHHLFHFDNCVVDGSKWDWFSTGIAEIGIGGEQNFTSAAWRLGASGGSTVSPLGVEKEDAIFVYGQSLSALSVEDPNYAANVESIWGKDGSAGMIVAARVGYKGTDMILEGNAEPINGKTKPHRYGGLYGWGNVCITGDVKAFKYNNNVYVGVAATNWNEPHFTVVDLTASSEGSTQYLLNTTGLTAGTMSGGSLSSVAYVYDAAADTGRLAVLYATVGNDKPSSVIRYDITRTKK